MEKFNRVIILILDSVGCGVLPDYKEYHEEHCNTLGNLYKRQNGFSLPNLEKLGLKRILSGSNENNFIAGIMKEKSKGNDTFAGVYEMIGVTINERFKSDKAGFPGETIRQIEDKIKNKVVGNEYISGFKALDKYFDEHKEKVAPILYFADDGVVLLAAHEDVIKPEILNSYGKQIAESLTNKNISRIITRPFIGEKGNFIRTRNRKDYLAIGNLEKKSLIGKLIKNKVKFLTTEHINNILGSPFGIKHIDGNYNNNDLTELIIDKIKANNQKEVMLFCLQDFDMYGHRKDPNGYAKSLLDFDLRLPSVISSLKDRDLLIITADHGCDPYINMRGHAREYVPLILYSKNLNNKKIWLGTRETFADIGQTICHNYSLPLLDVGSTIYEIF